MYYDDVRSNFNVQNCEARKHHCKSKKTSNTLTDQNLHKLVLPNLLVFLLFFHWPLCAYTKFIEALQKHHKIISKSIKYEYLIFQNHLCDKIVIT